MTDAELVQCAKEFRRGMLEDSSGERMCFAVSWPLQGFIAAMGVDSEVESVDFPQIRHYFLRLSDGRILDATADQFPPLPDVYLGHMPKQYTRWMRAYERTTAKLKQAVRKASL